MNRFIGLVLISSLLFSQQLSAEQGVNLQSGLIIDDGYKVVKQHCSHCHSTKLVVQSKMSRQGWVDTLQWMQKMQGMQLLKEQDEAIILNYLAKNYGADNTGRRLPLVVKHWYKF